MDLTLARQCSATSRSGERCKRPPIPGGSVCSMHGGNSPLARQAAQRRLIGMVEPALDGLEMAMRQDPCEKCGRPSDMNLVVRAAQIVLDRSGLGPQATMVVEQKVTIPSSVRWMKQAHLDQIAVWMAEAEERRRNGEAPDDVVEATVVEDGVLVDE